MKAPEKIYVTECMLFMTNPEITLQGNGNKIEYTRTDAFVDKAEKYLKNQFIDDVSILAGGVVHINFETAINNFINYMKGE